MAAKKKKTKSKVKAKAKSKKPVLKKKKKAAAKAPAPAKKKVAKAAKAVKPAKVAKPAKAAPVVEEDSEEAGEFPESLKKLEEIVNGGQAGEMDFEMYQSFNEQYKPSDWTRNPKSDDELWSFGMDGMGGQVALWRDEPQKELEDRPVVMLGSEGEVTPLATDLPSFLFLIASGVGPMEVLFDTVDWGSLESNEEMHEWLTEEWPDRDFAAPKKIIAEAKSKLKHFEKHLRAQCPAE